MMLKNPFLTHLITLPAYVPRFAKMQDELSGLESDDVYTDDEPLKEKKAVVVGYSDESDHMDYFVGLREGEKKIKRTHFSVPHADPFEIDDAELQACLKKPDMDAYKCIMERKKSLPGIWGKKKEKDEE